MRDKQLQRLTSVLGDGVLADDEEVMDAVQGIVSTVPLDQSGVGRAAREISKRVNARSAARNEGFVVLTDRRLLCLGKTAAGRPTSEVRASLSRELIASTDYSRGVMSTLTVVPTDGNTALAVTCGLMLRGSLDDLAKALEAS